MNLQDRGRDQAVHLNIPCLVMDRLRLLCLDQQVGAGKTDKAGLLQARGM